MTEMAALPRRGPRSELQEALLDASAVASERDAAVACSQPVRRVTRGGILAGLIAVVIGAGVWDVHVLTRSPEPLPAADLEVNLRWMVATAVEAIDDFHVAEGRLPSDVEIEAVLDSNLSYTSTGDRYVVTGQAGAVFVRYDGTVELDVWVGRSPGRHVTSGTGGGR